MTPTPAAAAPTPPGGRRARLRRQTLAELRVAALAELREQGPSGLSLRGVARRMDMSPAGLYRYVDSRDDLLTLLIADALDSLADVLDGALAEALAGADVADPAAQLEAVCLAYRAWSVDHPREFALVFGEPLPDYEAPAGGPTVEAMSRVGRALAAPLVAAWRAGRVRIPPELATAELDEATAPMRDPAGELPAGAHAWFLVVWGRVHGQVVLEVFGHHAWLFPDGCLPLYRAEIRSLARDLGMAD